MNQASATNRTNPMQSSKTTKFWRTLAEIPKSDQLLTKKPQKEKKREKILRIIPEIKNESIFETW